MKLTGLEVLSPRDGGWYDVILSQSRVIEWNDRLVLRLRLRGFKSYDDEILDYKETMSDAYFRLSARVIDDTEVNLLVPSMKVAGLAKSKTTDDSIWFDAVVLKVHKTTTLEDNMTLVTVKWLEREEGASFGTPRTNTLAVEEGEVCLLSDIPPTSHPSILKWRQLMREVYESEPKYVSEGAKCLKRRRKQSQDGQEFVSKGERDVPPLPLGEVISPPRGVRVSVRSVKRVVGQENADAHADVDSSNLDVLATVAAKAAATRKGDQPSGSEPVYEAVDGRKKLKKRRHSTPAASDRKNPKVSKKQGSGGGKLEKKPAGETLNSPRVPEIRSLVMSGFECDRNAGEEVVVGQSVVIEEVPDEGLDRVDDSREAESGTPEKSRTNVESQGPSPRIPQTEGGELTRKNSGIVAETELAVETFPVRSPEGGAGSRAKKKPRLSSVGGPSDAVAQGAPERNESEKTGHSQAGIDPIASSRASVQAGSSWRRGLSIPGFGKHLGGAGSPSDGEKDKTPISGDFIPVPRFEEEDFEGRGVEIDPEVVVVKEVFAGGEVDNNEDLEGVDGDQATEFIITARRCPKISVDVVGMGRGFACARDIRWKWNHKDNRCNALPPIITPLTTKKDDFVQEVSERTDQSPSLDDWNQDRGCDRTPPTPCSKLNNLDLSFSPSPKRNVDFPSSFVFGQGVIEKAQDGMQDGAMTPSSIVSEDRGG
ncbi:hypothetical protein BSKO_11960 [Bryopsis sp. KO-2023]|nr:hypothetical protein BSKO_11960 [Bryopsis sp. KO-2023]